MLKTKIYVTLIKNTKKKKNKTKNKNVINITTYLKFIFFK